MQDHIIKLIEKSEIEDFFKEQIKSKIGKAEEARKLLIVRREEIARMRMDLIEIHQNVGKTVVNMCVKCYIAF